jgi:hypothetical protein
MGDPGTVRTGWPLVAATSVAMALAGCVAEVGPRQPGEPELEGGSAPTSDEARERIEELAVEIGRELAAQGDGELHDEEVNDRIVADVAERASLPEDAELRYSRTFARFAYRDADGAWACAAIQHADDEVVDATTGACPDEIAEAG